MTCLEVFFTVLIHRVLSAPGQAHPLLCSSRRRGCILPVRDQVYKHPMFTSALGPCRRRRLGRATVEAGLGRMAAHARRLGTGPAWLACSRC